MRAWFVLLFLFFLPVLLFSKESADFIYDLTIKPHYELNRSVFSSSRISSSNYSSFYDLFSDLAGTSSAQYGPSGSLCTVNIRGAHQSQVLVMLNGIPLNNPQTGMYDLSMLPFQMFSGIDLIRGGVSSLYGAGASGGVINLSVFRETKGSYVELSQSLGSFGALSLNPFMALDLSEKWEFQTSFIYDRAENNYSYEDSFGEHQIRSNADYGRVAFFTALRYRGGKIHSSLYGLYSFKDTGLPGPSLNQDLFARQEDRSLILNSHSIVFMPLVTELYFSVYRSAQDYFDPPSEDIHKTEQYFIKAQQHAGTGNVSFLYGLEARFNRIQSTAVSEQSRLLSAHFASLELRSKAEMIRFTAKYRLSWKAPDSFVLTWNTGSNFLLPFNSVFRLNLGTSWKEPSFNDLYWPADVWAEGNPDLQPEHGLSFDAGFENNFFRFFYLDLNYFRNSYNDLIVWQPDPSDVWKPDNLNKALYTGGELGITLLPSDFLEFKFDYSKLYALDQTGGIFDGNIIPFKPHDRFQVRGTIKNRYFRFQVKYRYTGFSYNTRANIPGLGIQPAYSVLSAGCSLLPFRALEIRLSADNILDEDYQSVNAYPMPGRSFDLNMRYRYPLKNRPYKTAKGDNK